jgi:carbonic anhydrase
LRSGDGGDRDQGGARSDQRALPIYPAGRRSGGTDLEATIKANAKNQARILAGASPVLAESVKKGALKVVASYYDLATGKVTLLD